MKKCKLCGNEFKRMDIHVKKIHKISMEAYDKLPEIEVETNKLDLSKKIQTVLDDEKQTIEPNKVEDEFGEISEDELYKLSPTETNTKEQEETKVTKEKRREAIWSDVSSEGTLLSTFLDEIGISEKELRGLIKQHKSGSIVPIREQLKTREQSAESIAMENSDKPEITTKDVYIADALTNKFGYTCTQVIGHKDKDGDVRSKTWVLKKTA